MAFEAKVALDRIRASYEAISGTSDREAYRSSLDPDRVNLKCTA